MLRVDPEDAKDRASNHEFFVGACDTNPNAGGIRRDQVRISVISRIIEFDAEKPESGANPPANDERIFADASRKNQRVQSAQRGREGADPFPDLMLDEPPLIVRMFFPVNFARTSLLPSCRSVP